MTSKCGKNRKVAHEPIGEWVTDVKKPLGNLADAVDIDTLEAMRFELSINGVADGVLEMVEICVL